MYRGNRLGGPVYSMANLLTKFLTLGYSLQEVIDGVTVNPARWLGKPELAHIKVGEPANVTLFSVQDQEVTLIDSEGEERVSTKTIKAEGYLLVANTLSAKYGLKRVINASGRMTILGTSTASDTVMEAMSQGGQQYVEIADLVDRAGQYVAGIVGSEDAVVVNSASSGIALSIAALVTKGNMRKSLRLHQEPLVQNEIIMLKGHNVQYGAPIETMIYLGGGQLVEAGYANEGTADHMEEAITERTATIVYVKSHHAVQKNMIPVEDAWDVAKRNGIPLIVDAAAEEDLQKYVRYSDLVIYSGSKAIEGPTSGLVAGRKLYIDWIKVRLKA